MTDAGDDEDGWTYALDEVGPEAETDEPPIEPESITPEHAVFFLLGVAVFIVVVASILL